MAEREAKVGIDGHGYDPVDGTLATYEAIADAYAARGNAPVPSMVPFLDRIVGEIRSGGNLLELGSGPGYDADYLAARGVQVRRTDATTAFVQKLRAQGYDAHHLDIRKDPLGGPWDGVLASAVLLHLTTAQFCIALGRIADSLKPRGLFALTLKRGQGAAWTNAKVGMPRYFTYWQERPLRAALESAGLDVESVDHIPGSEDENWLYVICHRRGPDSAAIADQ